jgi:heterodisulfide reductase subunit C
MILAPSKNNSLAEKIRYDINSCYACGSCLSECPVNRAVDGLHPRTMVRLVAFGLMDELVHSPEIWYCISCKRCERACPMSVKPAGLIAAIRQEAYNSHVLSPQGERRLRSVYSQLHRVRRQVLDLCFDDKPIPDLASEWHRLAHAPLEGKFDRQPVLTAPSSSVRRASRNYLGFPTNVDFCFTCAECSNACPVACDRAVFDPMWINRMAAYGFFEEILRSPSIWLCIKCQSCTSACTQQVKGHLVISKLQEMAIKEGFIDPALKSRWSEMEKLVYMQFLKEIDAVRKEAVPLQPAL